MEEKKPQLGQVTTRPVLKVQICGDSSMLSTNFQASILNRKSSRSGISLCSQVTSYSTIIPLFVAILLLNATFYAFVPSHNIVLG